MRSRTAILVRWVARATGPDLVRHLLPPWTVLFLVLVELDVVVDFRETARIASALPPALAGAALAGVVAFTSVASRTFLAEVWLGPRHAVLRRQPLDPVRWGIASWVVVVPTVVPVGVAAGVWYGGTAWAPILTWTGLAVVPAVLVAGRRPFAGLLACAVAGGVAALGQAWPWLYVPASIATWAAAAPLSGAVTVRSAAWPGQAAERSPGRPRGPFSALLHRDGLALWRRERQVIWAALAGALPAGFVVGAASVNGEYPGSTLTRATAVVLASIGLVTLQAATGVARQLGRRFDPPEWPVSARQRAAALALVAGGTLAPGWAAAAVAGPPIGLGGHLRIAVFVAALAAGATWWVASRPARPNPGTWPYWIALCLAATVAPWEWTMGAAALAVLAFGGAVRALEAGRR
jgi:hypothetical protein